jgi:hypothetical protein
MKEISNIFRYSILISAKEAGVFLRELLQKDPTNLLYNSIISLAYKKFLGEDKLGEKFKRISERIYQRKRNNL